MNRRNIFRALFAATAGLAASRSSADAAASADAPRVVYHLADLEKATFVLGNIRNHIDGMGGSDKVTIAVVIHGAALRAFRADTTNHDVKAKVANFVREGVTFHACIHTMEAQHVTLDELLPGFAVADKGGVVKLAQLQQSGYAYLRP
jgi:hypothetical protein